MKDLPLNKIIVEDCQKGIGKLPDESLDCCITSPPYLGHRDYGHSDQIGLESSPDLYVEKMVSVFEQVRRKMKPTGTLWLNLGDGYAGSNGAGYKQKKQRVNPYNNGGDNEALHKKRKRIEDGLKPKDLIGIPWAVATALRDAGWYLRSDIIWAKKNCMPESVTDRPTSSHEHLFLLTKNCNNPLLWRAKDTLEWSDKPDLSEVLYDQDGDPYPRWRSYDYFYDHEAIKEDAIYDVDGTQTLARKARQKEDNKSMPTALHRGVRPAGFKDASKMNGKNADKQRGHSRRHQGFNERWDAMTKEEQCTGKRNKRDVWSVATAMFSEAHFATFPENLIIDCVKAGCPEGGVILDPFIGAGTTGIVAKKYHRNYIGFELNANYARIAEKRIANTFGLFI